MSSHREAPEISKDPVADSTDLYAFVSPDQPDTVTLIANYIPLQEPAGGPNFYEFGDDVLYEIHIDNNGDGKADISYQFSFETVLSYAGELPLQHRPDQVAQRPELEQQAVLLRHPGRRLRLQPPGQQPRLPALQRRHAVHAELRGEARAARRALAAAAASRSSPASAPSSSTSTWARSSTWATCARSSS